MSESIFDGLHDDLQLDDTVDTIMSIMSLKTEKCGLKHTPEEYNIPPPPAVDYLCQKLGYIKTGKNTEQIRVPICQECVNGLHDPEWALLYCIGCCNSQWVYKPRSSYVFHTDVVWLDICPHCVSMEDNTEIKD